jgi:hypothetical protein
MALSRDEWRRWLLGICVGTSAAMLALGLTVFKGRLRPRTFLYYWLVCMIVTGLTLIVALLDLRAVRLRARREELELVNRTLLEIKREKETKAARAKQGRPE